MKFLSSLKRSADYWICHHRFTADRLCAVFVGAALIVSVALPAHSEDLGTVSVHPELSGFRYGISVTDLDGNVLVAHKADERFMPASNAKLFVTAAALAAESELSDLDSGLRVLLETKEDGPPNIVLEGRGDPTIGFGADCEVKCIETLAAEVVKAGFTEVGDIIGDDRWFADQRRPLGWSWDDLKFGHGTSISSLAINDNVLPLRVTPSGKVETPVHARWLDTGQSYFDVHNEATTSEEGLPVALRLERRVGERNARLYGELPRGSRSLTIDLGVDDPAHLAAWYFKRALEAKGVFVSGEVKAQHRPLQYADEPQPVSPDDASAPLRCGHAPVAETTRIIIASLPPAPIQEIVTEINRESQNLYAEMMLRQLGRINGRGSSFCGLLEIQDFLETVGITREFYDLADGSGLSNYNRATPATITSLLRYAAATDWGEAFKASLPVSGGSTGTLRYRFRGSELEGKVFAKTGTLNHVDALSGYMQARSGRTLAFSIIVNDRPLEAPSARDQIDSMLLSIYEQY
ncbi:MAG: D-alanyl-D-alanine carboxypeptidase/D-alanyl-D-alanine-endopeptidase [Pseudomonadota bacterium]